MISVTSMKKTETPLISVIMGVCYQKNDVAPLEKSIDSILKQSYANFEFLICENGSNDKALKVLDSFEKKDARIRLVDGTGTKTLAEKLNRCIQESKGTWIARMDDDDVSYPERFKYQLEFLLKHKRLSGVGTWVREVDGKRNYIRKLPEKPRLSDFRLRLPFVHPTLMLSRAALLSICGYSESDWQIGCDDYELLMRMYEKGYEIENIPMVLLDYSIISSQIRTRPYRLFLNEFFTRIKCFYKTGKLPQWIFWAVKPLMVGLVPRKVLYRLKHRLKR